MICSGLRFSEQLSATCYSHIFLRLHAWDERHLMYRLITWRRFLPKASFREDWQLMNGCSKWWMAVDNSSIINISIMIIIYYLIWIILLYNCCILSDPIFCHCIFHYIPASQPSTWRSCPVTPVQIKLPRMGTPASGTASSVLPWSLGVSHGSGTRKIIMDEYRRYCGLKWNMETKTAWMLQRPSCL